MITMTKYIYKAPTPEGKISRDELAEEFGVIRETIKNYEDRHLIPKGETIKGHGGTYFYDISVMEELRAQLKTVKRKKKND
jgi:DNA-binding transcriptional MerR regulator